MFFSVTITHLEIEVTGNPGIRRHLGASVALDTIVHRSEEGKVKKDRKKGSF